MATKKKMQLGGSKEMDGKFTPKATRPAPTKSKGTASGAGKVTYKKGGSVKK
jgi:hypothetical protein